MTVNLEDRNVDLQVEFHFEGTSLKVTHFMCIQGQNWTLIQVRPSLTNTLNPNGSLVFKVESSQTRITISNSWEELPVEE